MRLTTRLRALVCLAVVCILPLSCKTATRGLLSEEHSREGNSQNDDFLTQFVEQNRAAYKEESLDGTVETIVQYLEQRNENTADIELLWNKYFFTELKELTEGWGVQSFLGGLKLQGPCRSEERQLRKLSIYRAFQSKKTAEQRASHTKSWQQAFKSFEECLSLANDPFAQNKPGDLKSVARDLSRSIVPYFGMQTSDLKGLSRRMIERLNDFLNADTFSTPDFLMMLAQATCVMSAWSVSDFLINPEEPGFQSAMKKRKLRAILVSGGDPMNNCLSQSHRVEVNENLWPKIFERPLEKFDLIQYSALPLAVAEIFFQTIQEYDQGPALVYEFYIHDLTHAHLKNDTLYADSSLWQNPSRQRSEDVKNTILSRQEVFRNVVEKIESLSSVRSTIALELHFEILHEFPFVFTSRALKAARAQNQEIGYARYIRSFLELIIPEENKLENASQDQLKLIQRVAESLEVSDLKVLREQEVVDTSVLLLEN